MARNCRTSSSDLGAPTFGDDATKRLESLAKALRERDSLKLEITGRADPEVDKEGIKRVAMERAVKAEKLKEQIRKDGEGGSVDAVEVDPAEYPEYLKRAYKEAKFPETAQPGRDAEGFAGRGDGEADADQPAGQR